MGHIQYIDIGPPPLGIFTDTPEVNVVAYGKRLQLIIGREGTQRTISVTVNALRHIAERLEQILVRIDNGEEV